MVDGALAGEAGTTLLVESLWWSGEHHGGDPLWNGQGGDHLLSDGEQLQDLGSHNLFGIGPCVCMLHLEEGHRQHLGFWLLGVEEYAGVQGKCWSSRQNSRGQNRGSPGQARLRTNNGCLSAEHGRYEGAWLGCRDKMLEKVLCGEQAD